MSRRSILILVASVASCAVLVPIIIAIRRTPAERICRNLISAGYYNTESECVLSGYPPEYMAVMFPLQEVNIDYVRTGMDGFRVAWEKKTDTGITVIVYHIEGFLVSMEFYRFAFDDNGRLISATWQN